VREALDGWAPPAAVRSPSSKPDSMQRLLAAVDAAYDASVGLSFVPRVIQLLGADMDAEVAKSLLTDAANRGLLELRPEGGIGRLSTQELELCPPGPQGTWLSWARRRNEGTSQATGVEP
jgi:hypothetical protein